MKIWKHSNEQYKEAESDEVRASDNSSEKLERTPESGHSLEGRIRFDTFEDYLRWWEEEDLYED